MKVYVLKLKSGTLAIFQIEGDGGFYMEVQKDGTVVKQHEGSALEARLKFKELLKDGATKVNG